MRYILPTDALSDLKNLRHNYQAARKVDLTKEPSMLSLPKFLGGTDVSSRSKQVCFIEKIIAAFAANLLEFKDIDSLPQRHCTLESYRTLLAACLFVQSQINGTKSHSELYKLIKKAMGINKNNFFDAQDKEICYQSAYLYLVNNSKALAEANAAIEETNAVIKKAKTDIKKAKAAIVEAGAVIATIEKSNAITAEDNAAIEEAKAAIVKANDIIEKATPISLKDKLEPFLAKEWSDFISYLQKETKTPPPPNNWPITSFTKPLFGMTFTYAGATLGFLVGEVASNSTKIMSSKLQLTAVVGSSMIFLGSASPAGVAFIAPAIAAKLIDTFFRISLADIMAFLMNLVGQGVGIGIGAPLDLAYRILCCICNKIGQMLHSEPQSPKIDGLHIADGKYTYQGIVLELIPVENLPENYAEEGMQITEEGKLLVKGKAVDLASSIKQLPPEVLEQLRNALATKPQSQNEQEDEESDNEGSNKTAAEEDEDRAAEQHVQPHEVTTGVALHP